MTSARIRGLLALVALAFAPVRRARAEEPAQWHYVVDVAPDLSRLDVHVEFANFLPKRLALAGGGALDAVTVHEADGADVEVQREERAVRLDAVDTHGGLRYSVDLAAAAKARGGVTRTGEDLVTQTGSWLLRPLVVPVDARFTAVVRTPPGVGFAVPWPSDGATVEPDGTTSARFHFDRSTWSMVGHAVFGRFARQTLEVAGASFDVVTLARSHQATPEGLRRWLRAAIEGIALLHGKFPVPRVLIVVAPVPGSRGDPVSFGSTWYGGGPHVILDVADVATDDDLVGEWVALHELLHTTMPSVAVEDAWLSEGFVTYYQEVLRARARFHSPVRSWQLIAEGYDRGRSVGTGAALAKESATMRSNHTYWRVYWAGAAIAMRLDVELRRASGGKRSLDDVMRHWSRRAGEVEEVSAASLVTDADALLGAPIFATSTAPLLASPKFPDVAPMWRWLGVSIGAGGVTCVDAEGAGERDRIMASPARATAAPVPPAPGSVGGR